MNINPIESNIHLTKSGTYKVRWRRNGKNEQKTFAKKVDAIVFQSELLTKCDSVSIGIKKIKFEDFAGVWLDRHCELNVEESTAIDYEQKLFCAILPYFKDKYLQEIDEDDVIKFKEHLQLVKKYKPVTVGGYLRQLKLMFKCACIWKDDNKRPYLKINPALHVKEPKKPDIDFNFWTSEEIVRFLSFTKDRAPFVFEIVALVTSTGLRRGEVHQLQRDALDFENRIITVKRSFSFAARKPKAPKGGKIRRIPMNQEVYELLVKYSDLPLEKRIYEGENIAAFYKKLEKWCPLAKVSVVTLHDLRDTFASSLVKAGKKVKVIQYLMGHVNISTTESYMHLDPNDLESSTDCLNTGVISSSSRQVNEGPSNTDGGKTGVRIKFKHVID